jgi:hypothetical protein
MGEARRRRLAAAAAQLVVEQLDAAETAAEAARPPGVDPIAWLESLPVPDFVPFDPAAVRIERGRIKLPGIGWVPADVAPLPHNERLAVVRAREGADGWSVEIETEVVV